MKKKIRMALIATYPKMSEIFLNLAEGREDIEAHNIYASFERAVDIAKKMEDDLDIILSRGGTAAYIQRAVKIPVSFIPITPFDVIKIVHELDPDVGEIAFIHYMKNVPGIQDIAAMYGIRIREYAFINYQDIEDSVQDAYDKGIRTIVGGEVAVRAAKGLGIRGIEVSAGKEAVSRAIDESIQMVEEVKKERDKATQIGAAFNSVKEGVIVTDREKRIVLINPAADRLFNRKYKVGQPAGADVVNERCEGVYTRHTEESVYLARMRQEIYAISHLPIIQKGKFLGVVSRYEDVTKTQELEQKIRKEIHAKGFVARYHFENIVTGNSLMEEVKRRSSVYAKTESSVLITGESGTGKELFAQSIHNASVREDRPFVAVNCAALPENLLESELFGYEKGAFTGANREGKAGLFELAHLGTIFLDEIGEISKNMQTRLLRVLQEKEIMRIGGDKIIPVDVRVISATNKDLKKEIRDGSFREDLYYRLNVLQIHIPALRERGDDVAALARHFSQAYDVDGEALEAILPLLEAYRWPGNIRELQNTVERFCVLRQALGDEGFREEYLGDVLGTTEERQTGSHLTVDIPFGGELGEIVEQVEYEVTRWYLREYGDNQDRAAKALGIGRTTFWRKSKGKNKGEEEG